MAFGRAELIILGLVRGDIALMLTYVLRQFVYQGFHELDLGFDVLDLLFGHLDACYSCGYRHGHL
ncbi:MAG: hypothetical protein ACRDS9_05795 [Pseudonocardiaceae bacterium]